MEREAFIDAAQPSSSSGRGVMTGDAARDWMAAQGGGG